MNVQTITSKEKIPVAIQPIASREEVHAALNIGIRSMLTYTHEVASGFFNILKKPLPFILVIWVLVSTLNSLSISLRSAISPLCGLPGSSLISICKHLEIAGVREVRPSYTAIPEMMEKQSKAFEQLLDESVESSSLALEIQKAEMATEDLVVVVMTGDLAGKEDLAKALAKFADSAQYTAKGLHDLKAAVGSAVDW